MNDDRVVEFPVRYEGEIALAERSYDLLAERLARGRLPDETSPQGVMYAEPDAKGTRIRAKGDSDPREKGQ